MNVMTHALTGLRPELVMLTGAVICLFTGISKWHALRRATIGCAAASLVLAGYFVNVSPCDPENAFTGMTGLTHFFKLAAVVLGLILLMMNTGETDASDKSSDERRINTGPIAPRSEFFAFFLLSLTGLMLTAGAGDLVWLLLALELTSLPTYVMIAMSRAHRHAAESSVKYFFLGALSVAVLLLGFTLIYGATGYTDFDMIQASIQTDFAHRGGNSTLMMTGLILAILGVAFKIAAVPMHFYVADVYQGCSASVAAFLAFVPKAAGFAALIALLHLTGSHIPKPLAILLWLMTVITMVTGNVLALIQHNVKRILAYSSIAHSGYMLAGLLAGLQLGPHGQLPGNGFAALLFYLVAYGFAATAAFAVIGSLATENDETQTLDDLSGLWKHDPLLAGIMLISVLSLLGLPPLVGFIGKLQLINAAYQADMVILAVILVLNSAISAAYYLRIASACFFGKPVAETVLLPVPARRIGAITAAVFIVYLGLAGGLLVKIALQATMP